MTSDMSRRWRLPPSALRRKWRSDLWHRKGRTALVTLGILIGVVGLTATNTAAGWLAAAFANASHETGVFTIMRTLSGLSLALTGFLIFNTVTTQVAEQTRTIGIMKTLGATRRIILQHELTFVGGYAACGAALGLLLGLLVGAQLTLLLIRVLSLGVDLGPFQVDAGVVLVSILAGVGIPLLAALLPLWSGTRITVREALSGYGVARVSASSAERARSGRRPQEIRLAGRWRWLPPAPQTLWLGARGLFRKRGRAVLTLAALTLSGAVFLAIQTTAYAADQYRLQLFALYGEDATVTVGNPQPFEALRAQLLALPNVAQVERLEAEPVTTHWGTMVLTGIEPNTQLYHYQTQLVAGRWFHGEESGVLVISDILAQRTGLAVGALVTCSTPTASTSYRVIGVVHDLSGSFGALGLGFTPIEPFHRFEGLPTNVGSSFLIGAKDHAPAAVDQMASRLDTALSQAGLAPTVETRQQQFTSNARQFELLYLLLLSGAALVGLVGLLGLSNTLTTSVLERRREIGILRALGASRWQVASVCWTEGLALAGIAWLVAVLVGIPGAYAFLALLSAVLVPIPFAFDPGALGAMLGVILGIATLASVGPALRAARMRLADTLQYE